MLRINLFSSPEIKAFPQHLFFLGAITDFEQCEHDRRTEAAAAPASNRVD